MIPPCILCSMRYTHGFILHYFVVFIWSALTDFKWSIYPYSPLSRHCNWGNRISSSDMILSKSVKLFVTNQHRKQITHCMWNPWDVLYRSVLPLIARFVRPTWHPYGAERTQVDPMLAPWTLLSGTLHDHIVHTPFYCDLLNLPSI